jgi:mannose-6-phosphate isomerase-like protein (cupin superfamily)
MRQIDVNSNAGTRPGIFRRGWLIALGSLLPGGLPFSCARRRKPPARPLPVRRIVTHSDGQGLSYALMDGPATNVLGTLTELWATGSNPADFRSTADAGASSKNLEPPPDGTVFRFFQVPPRSESAGLSPEEIRKAWADGFRMLNAPDAQPDTRRDPGMHKTSTTDYIVVLSGRITLVLDKCEHDLRPFDTVIQRGTNHSWVNRGEEDALLMAVLVDAKGTSSKP